MSAGETISEGQLFVIRGLGFLSWPTEIIAAYTEDRAINYAAFDPSNQSVFTLESKTNSVLVMRANYTYTYTDSHTWAYFATPYETPRTILGYSESQ